MLGEDGKFKVAMKRARLGMGVADDEIDLDTSFIMLPSTIPQPDLVAPFKSFTGAGDSEQLPVAVPTRSESPVAPPAVETEKVVQISFSADRNTFFTACNATTNVADMAGEVICWLWANSIVWPYRLLVLAPLRVMEWK